MSRPWSGMEVVQVLGNTELGGAVPVVAQICDVCAGLDLRPVVLATNPDVVSYFEDRGWPVWRFPGIVREPHPLGDLWTARVLARELAARGVRIVHTHTSKGGMIGRLGGRLAHCDLVIHHTHGFYHTGLRPGPERGAMIALEWVFGQMGDYQLFVNSADRDEAIRRHFIRAQRARTVFNGVPDPMGPESVSRPTIRDAWGVPVDAPVLGVVSRLVPRKGVDTCIRAFAGVLSRVPDAWLVVIGKGPEQSRLKDLSDSLGVSHRVRLLGHVDDAGRLYSALDVALTASAHEGQSVSVIESIACGTPVVATSIRGHWDAVIPGRTGMLCPVGDWESMADDAVRLLTDLVLRDLMSVEARKHYEKCFTLDHFEREMTEFYECALAESVT